jgi:hypothetical protein
MRLKLTGFIPEPEKPKEYYRLTVSGIVGFNEENIDLKELLLAKGKDKLIRQLPEALQELEEESTEIKITLEKIDWKGHLPGGI